MSNVTHPAHYNSGKIEVIEAIEDWKLGFHRGNAVKYTARAGKKDASKEIEDLEKAVWYLNREIEKLKAAKEGREPMRPNDMNPRSTSATGALNSKEHARPPVSALRVQYRGTFQKVKSVFGEAPHIALVPFAPYSELEKLVGCTGWFEFAES